jgi:hypothetical protein
MKTGEGFVVKAQYRPCPIRAFKGNPLIEALPPIISDEELIKHLACTPKISPEERELPPEIRKTALVALEEFTYPLPEYLDFARRIESAIYRGYSSKNPLLPTSNHYLHYLDPDETTVQPISGRFESRATGITLAGPSGSGKNWMFERVLSMYPQVIVHEKYDGKSLPITQLVWIKVSCPGDGSLVSFVSSILMAIDRALGTEHFEEARKGRFNKSLLSQQVNRLVRTYRIGLIVIDEFSNLKLPKKATPDDVPTLTRLILNLMNGAGVPILFCGNPEMIDIVQLSLKTARRAENGGVVTMGPLHLAVWEALSKRLWALQMTDCITPWSKRQADKLNKASRGLVEIAVRGFFEAQRLVIGSGDERLTDVVIAEGAAKAIALSDKTLDWSVSQNITDTLWVPIEIPDPEIENNSDTQEKPKISKKRATGTRSIFDPYRPQHPEFEPTITQMLYKPRLISEQCHRSILRDAIDEENILVKLSDENLIFEDVLSLELNEQRH